MHEYSVVYDDVKQGGLDKNFAFVWHPTNRMKSGVVSSVLNFDDYNVRDMYR